MLVQARNKDTPSKATFPRKGSGKSSTASSRRLRRKVQSYTAAGSRCLTPCVW